jgi:hypothetical protein
MISFLFLPLYVLLCPDFTAADSPTVALAYGTFQGFARGNVTQFLGVPFGQACVPGLGIFFHTFGLIEQLPSARFSVPQEPALLHGLQNATSFGPACLNRHWIFRPVSRLLPIHIRLYLKIVGLFDSCISPSFLSFKASHSMCSSLRSRTRRLSFLSLWYVSYSRSFTVLNIKIVSVDLRRYTLSGEN